MIGVFIVVLLEKMFDDRHLAGGFTKAFGYVISHRDIYHVWATIIGVTASILVYNSFGQKVKEIINVSGQTITLNRENLSSGVYFIRLIQDNKIIATDKLVITD